MCHKCAVDTNLQKGGDRINNTYQNLYLDNTRPGFSVNHDYIVPIDSNQPINDGTVKSKTHAITTQSSFKIKESPKIDEPSLQQNIEKLAPYVQERYYASSSMIPPAILKDVSEQLAHLTVEKWNKLLEKVELSEALHILHTHQDKGSVFLQIFAQKKECNWEHLIHSLEEMGLSNAASILDTWYLGCQNDTDYLAESCVSHL